MSQSIRKRIAASVVANIARSGISFATSLLIARWLGPVDFGRMAFLIASFLAFQQLLDMGTSSAFFTFLSQRPRSARFIGYFWRWVGIQLLLSLAFVCIVLNDGWLNSIWKDESRGLVALALVATFMQHVIWLVASQMAEAQRETVRVQVLQIAVVIVHLGLVLALWWVGRLALPVLFAVMAAEWAAAAWLAARMYRSDAGHSDTNENSPGDTMASVAGEFWRYCLPLVPLV